MKNILLGFVMLTILGACSISAHYVQSGAQLYAETEASNVEIYAGDIDKDYDVIGSIAVDVAGIGENAQRYLQKRAAKLGADAVINCDLSKMCSYAGRTGISGVAVKYK